MSYISAVTQRRRKFGMDEKEKERIIDAFDSNPRSTHRVVTKVLKRILIDGPYMLNGVLWDIKTKSLGAGVYEISLVRRN